MGDLAALARQMIERSRTAPDRDTGTFDERAVWLQTTIGGAGRLTGDLTGPAAAVTAVLEALSAQSFGGEPVARSRYRRCGQTVGGHQDDGLAARSGADGRGQ